MSSKRVWAILLGLSGALLLHQGYHWLEKEWSTAILSEGDDNIEVSTEETSQRCHPQDSLEPNETSPNQFGAPVTPDLS